HHAFGEALFGRLGYGAGLSATAAPELAFLEHGPRLGASARLGPAVRLALDARLLWRDFAPVASRNDVLLDAAGTLEVDLHPRWPLQLEATALQAHSSAATPSFSTLAAGVGLQYLGAIF